MLSVGFAALVILTSRETLLGYWHGHDFPILDDARTSKARRIVGQSTVDGHPIWGMENVR
jgi:hypothetical protein